jgi:hypothetical protein
MLRPLLSFLGEAYLFVIEVAIGNEKLRRLSMVTLSNISEDNIK